MLLFLQYSALSESAGFLRRLFQYGRPRVIPLLRELPGGACECPMEGATPPVACRLWERRAVRWRHVFRTLWPQSYRTEEASLTIVIQQSLISFTP
jgi:hypothetical protein